jgi:glutathione S-transferase
MPGPDLTIYGIARSRAFRVLWMAAECGLAYEHVPVTWTDGGTRTPEFLALNPNAAVPVIRDGDFVLWDSSAICLYLAKRHGNRLYPADPRQEALALQWTFFAVTDFESPQNVFYYHRHALPEAERDPKLADKAWADLQRPLGVLDRTLAGRPWLLGDTFGIADFMNACVAYVLWYNRADLSAWPHLTAWLAKCYERPAAQEARRLRE